MSAAALAIFVKTPGLSPLKTRLAASIGTARAERFHQLAAAAVAEVAVAAKPSIDAYWAVAEADAMTHPHWQTLPTLWQGEGALGTRLDCVCAQLQSRYGRALLIGADAPQITVDLLAAALTALDDAATPFALGRAGDGGFWLFGTRVPVPIDVWQAPRYSQSRTADELVTALAPHGAIAELPTLTDLDTAHDLPALIAELAALREPSPAQRALREWLHAPG